MICLNKTRLTQHFGTVFQMIWRNRVTLLLLVSSAATNGNHLSGLIWRQLIIIQKQERHQNFVNITELNQLFGNKPSTKPDFTLHSSESSDCSTSSSNKKAAQKLVSENKHQSKNCSDASGSDDNEFNVVAPKKKQMIVGREKRKSFSMIDFLTEYKEEQKEE